MSDKLADNFKALLGEPISKEQAIDWHEYFINAIKNGVEINLPYAFKITKTFIDAIRSNPAVDGLELVLIAYDKDGVSPHLKTVYKKDDLSIVLAPVENGVVRDDLLYDYTDPCKPPCTKLDTFKKKPKP